jgi:hypothetical protein
MKTSKRFFYLLIVISIVVALFYSTLLGLIILVADIGYYFYLGRRARMATLALAGRTDAQVSKETIIQKEVVRIPCKYCNTLLDPVNDATCPNCGAPVKF